MSVFAFCFQRQHINMPYCYKGKLTLFILSINFLLLLSYFSIPLKWISYIPPRGRYLENKLLSLSLSEVLWSALDTLAVHSRGRNGATSIETQHVRADLMQKTRCICYNFLSWHIPAHCMTNLKFNDIGYTCTEQWKRKVWYIMFIKYHIYVENTTYEFNLI